MSAKVKLHPTFVPWTQYCLSVNMCVRDTQMGPPGAWIKKPVPAPPHPMQSDTEMRRLGSCLDWEDAALVGRLYALFLGTLAPKNATSRQLPKPGEVQGIHSTAIFSNRG